MFKHSHTSTHCKVLKHTHTHIHIVFRYTVLVQMYNSMNGPTWSQMCSKLNKHCSFELTYTHWSWSNVSWHVLPSRHRCCLNAHVSPSLPAIPVANSLHFFSPLSLSAVLIQYPRLPFSSVLIAATGDKTDLFSVIIPLAPLDLHPGSNHLHTHTQAHPSKTPLHTTRG